MLIMAWVLFYKEVLNVFVHRTYFLGKTTDCNTIGLGFVNSTNKIDTI